MTCDFEHPAKCGYQQAINDDFDWYLHSGSTGSSSTGPTADHTYGTLDGKVITLIFIIWLAVNINTDKLSLSVHVS